MLRVRVELTIFSRASVRPGKGNRIREKPYHLANRAGCLVGVVAGTMVVVVVMVMHMHMHMHMHMVIVTTSILSSITSRVNLSVRM